ncbi:insulin gene enhancer protein ISL-1 isoform X3 [Bradysia coprophila]|uniref:insulin gene enhancer protein ISL-1 isoform X3 n=1 Tax=Bradysia coprophila TaxID=38358 RepID=UPI00187DA4E2|nr:insulin gene enhancer protein ISL-1 isoform X3 [Bradysia coprophila]
MVMAEIGGPLAHQLPLHNHRGGLVQPSLVMNHHLDLDCHGADIHQSSFHFKNDDHEQHTIKLEKQRFSLCAGCGAQNHDQYILRVAPDLEWHAACLKCQECRQFLDESCTCFVRDGKTYCKRDYVRLFGTKCDKCGSSFSKNDYVMRAKTKIYHVDCFRCSVCTRKLLIGDEFALRDGGSLYCKADNDMLEKSSLSIVAPSLESNNNNNNTNLSNNNHSSEIGSMSDSGSESGSHKSIRDKRPSGPSGDGKPTRVRTVLNEKQLHTLRNFYNANPRPDALMKEQIVEMSGLSPRVIRVWFQNKRCKDKKNQIKQELQQEKLGYDQMQGVPMIANSPVRQGSPLNMHPHDVIPYQPPWKALSEFALHANLDNDVITQHNPAFQRLMHQMHGYDVTAPRPGNADSMSTFHGGHLHNSIISAQHNLDSSDAYIPFMESDDSTSAD